MLLTMSNAGCHIQIPEGTEVNATTLSLESALKPTSANPKERFPGTQVPALALASPRTDCFPLYFLVLGPCRITKSCEYGFPKLWDPSQTRTLNPNAADWPNGSDTLKCPKCGVSGKAGDGKVYVMTCQPLSAEPDPEAKSNGVVGSVRQFSRCFCLPCYQSIVPETTAEEVTESKKNDRALGWGLRPATNQKYKTGLRVASAVWSSFATSAMTVFQNQFMSRIRTEMQGTGSGHTIMFEPVDPEANNKEVKKVIKDERRLCGFCKNTEATHRCGGCLETYYCSKACQKSHWKVHKKDCRVLQAVRDMSRQLGGSIL